MFRKIILKDWIPTGGIWSRTCGASSGARRTEISAQDPVHLKKRKKLKGETWIKVSLQPQEIETLVQITFIS